ncbi:hypothetical protein CROQUDRAFT_183584 [Cronartium quercuum f. sp. fusiforme G11]|uniref:Ubiquitin-like domain-containing protein n=1 Tax=Cronartium quercuum f. sp. fusiforme G11 TaxID=708437 RepID=A0A9P6NC60_9BASI|nr:hypothetical protein CROQUDRAFT_183584 [Cronartium quercuum f. sp. fusiforme G11]
MDDDSLFATIEGLDPALAQATRELKNVGQASSHPLTGSHVGTQSKWSGHEIQLSINLVFDPRKIATSSPEHRAMYERVFTVEIGTREEFSKVYEFVKAMNPHLPPHFVIARDHSKLSPFVTPESVHIITDTSLKAYEIDVWNYIKANPDRLVDKPVEPNPLVLTNISSLPSNLLPSHSAGDEHEAEKEHEGTITIRVRSGKEEGLEMLVKPTTKMITIARQFIKQIKSDSISEDQVKNQLSNCRLEFDGEHLDLSKRVQEIGIEDGEMIDITF